MHGTYNWEKHAAKSLHMHPQIDAESSELVMNTAQLLYREVGSAGSRGWFLSTGLDRLKNPLKYPFFHPDFDQFFPQQAKDPVDQRIYSRLPTTRSARVFKLLPTVDNTAEVRCRLQTVTLGGHRQYDALSYTWGGTSMHETIFVDGVPMPVTKNAASILRRLAAQEEGRVPSIWMDSVSMNLSDKEELSFTIPMLPDVFRNAAEVIVSLGEEAPDVAPALSLMFKLASTLEKLAKEPTLNVKKTRLTGFLRSNNEP